MFYITKDCNLARTILKSNLYKIVSSNALLTLLPQDPSKNSSGFVDGFIIDGQAFDKILETCKPEKLGSLIHDSSKLYVVSAKSYNLPTTKVIIVGTKEQLVKHIDLNNVVPLVDSQSFAKVEPLTIKPQETVKEETVPMSKVEPTQEPVPEEPTPEPVHEESTVKPINVNIDHKVSLTNLNLYDLIRVAYTQNEKFKSIKDQLELLRGQLKNLNTTNLDNIIDRYLVQEDDACIELINEFRYILKDLVNKYEVNMENRVNNMYTQVVELISKDMYGLTQETITRLINKKADLAKQLRQCMNEILSDFGNVHVVATQLANLIMPFNFNTDGDADLPLIYDRENLNSRRFDLYKALVEIKASCNDNALIDKLKVAIGIVEMSSEVQDELTRKITSVSPFILQKNGFDIIYDTGKHTYTVLKTVLMKNKLLSLSKIILIDLVGKYGHISEFDNNLEYMQSIPTNSDPTKNYIIIDSQDRFFNMATNIFIPVDYKSVNETKQFVNTLKQNLKARIAMIMTPGNYEMYDKLGTENLIIVPYIESIAEDVPYDDFKNVQDVYKVVLKMR